MHDNVSIDEEILESPKPDSLLDHYHCTFFLPLLGLPTDFPEPAEHFRKTYHSGEALDDIEDAEAFLFFTPTLRNILFDQDNANKSQGKPDSDPLKLEPMREWVLDAKDYADWVLTLEATEEEEDKISTNEKAHELCVQVVSFKSVRLFRYFNGIYLLAYTVEPEALKVLRDKDMLDNLPQRAVELAEGYELAANLQLEAWLRFTRLARQLYPTFTEQRQENKIAALTLDAKGSCIKALATPMDSTLPENAGDELSEVVLFLLKQFFEPAKQPVVESLVKQHIQLFDDRMFVSVAYGLAGKQYEDLHHLRTLTAVTDRFVDAQHEDHIYSYHKPATDQMLDCCEFDLWAHIGSYYIFNDMVNAYIGNGGFFRTVIADKHIPTIYDRMMIQALFYQASLRHYDHQITEQTQLLFVNNDDKGIKTIRKQREGFARFTNQYWFQTITHQMQGKEIFRLQQQGLDIASHYDQLQDELSRTSDYLQALHDSQVSSNANRIGWGAFILALVAVLPVVNDIFKAEDDSFWKIAVDWVSGTFCFSTMLAKSSVAVLLIAIMLALLWGIFGKKR